MKLRLEVGYWWAARPIDLFNSKHGDIIIKNCIFQPQISCHISASPEKYYNH